MFTCRHYVHSFKQILVNAEAIRQFSDFHEEFVEIFNGKRSEKRFWNVYPFKKKLIATNICVVNGKWELSAHVKYLKFLSINKAL